MNEAQSALTYWAGLGYVDTASRGACTARAPTGRCVASHQKGQTSPLTFGGRLGEKPQMRGETLRRSKVTTHGI